MTGPEPGTASPGPDRAPGPSSPDSSPPGPAEPLDQSGPATHGPYLSSGPSARDAPPAPPIPPASPPLWQGQPRWSRGQFAAVLILVAILVGSGSFAGAYFYHSRSQTLAAAPPSNLLPPSTPAALSRIALTQQDVGSTVNVQTISQGRSLGQPTLDLCNGTYPSESLRTSRLQVAASDSQGSTLLSTEAVLYRNAAATQQAFSELAAAASNCPSSPVQSPVGEPTVITKFNAAPDGSWPQVQGVQRQAYDFVTTDGSGQTTHSVAVYMRRGRVLLGAYFSQPDAPQTSVAGQSTIATIQNVLAARIAQLPASEIGA